MSCKKLLNKAQSCIGKGVSAQTYETSGGDVLRVSDRDTAHGLKVHKSISQTLGDFIPKLKVVKNCQHLVVPKCSSTPSYVQKDATIVIMEDVGFTLKHYWKNRLFKGSEFDAAVDVCMQVLRFLQSFQSLHKGVHFDMHCNNVCVSAEGKVKIIDFDLAMTKRHKLPSHRWFPEYGVVHRDFEGNRGYDQVYFANDFASYIKSKRARDWVLRTVALGGGVDDRLGRPLDPRGRTPEASLGLFFSGAKHGSQGSKSA